MIIQCDLWIIIMWLAQCKRENTFPMLLHMQIQNWTINYTLLWANRGWFIQCELFSWTITLITQLSSDKLIFEILNDELLQRSKRISWKVKLITSIHRCKYRTNDIILTTFATEAHRVRRDLMHNNSNYCIILYQTLMFTLELVSNEHYENWNTLDSNNNILENDWKSDGFKSKPLDDAIISIESDILYSIHATHPNYWQLFEITDQ